ncbi:UNVERIFIED_CONTAM: hypothetical protein Sradi_7263200 [Sesamum radiatum]|uniref:Uncharacterized protein n=1 Tax=Sesamum radiatum TaxID=300843 RepID=A0AAW2IKH6_SESRA
MEFSKVSYHGRRQLVEPLLHGSGKCRDENSTLDVVGISMQQGCVLKSGQMFLWICGAIIFCYGRCPIIQK